MDSTEILSLGEIGAVLADLRRRSKRSPQAKLNLAIFRLACCCGMRRIEICGVELRDFVFGGARPSITIRKEVTKGEDGKRRGRSIPLWWDAGTRDDLLEWFQVRSGVAGDREPFAAFQKRLQPDFVSSRWKTAIKTLGADRVSQLSVHSGRHTFITHSLSIGHSLKEVQDAAGHANVSTTSLYLHYLEKPGVPDVFSFIPEGMSND